MPMFFRSSGGAQICRSSRRPWYRANVTCLLDKVGSTLTDLLVADILGIEQVSDCLLPHTLGNANGIG